MAVLIIEDTPTHFKKIYKYISDDLEYKCYPENQGESEILIRSIREWLGNGEWPEDGKPLERYLGLDIDLIILDMTLNYSMKEEGGKRLLEAIRENHKLVPILILTVHDFDSVASCFTSHDVVANYYLQKSLDGEILSEAFFEERLRPVVRMLCFWKRFAFDKADVTCAIENQKGELLSAIEAQNGLLVANFNNLSEEINTGNKEIVSLVKILIQIIRAQVKTDDKRLSKLIDGFLIQFDAHDFENLPQVMTKKEQALKALTGVKEKMISMLKDESKDIVKDDLIDFIKETILEVAGCDDDDYVSAAIAKLLYRSIGKTWEFIQFKS